MARGSASPNEEPLRETVNGQHRGCEIVAFPGHLENVHEKQVARVCEAIDIAGRSLPPALVLNLPILHFCIDHIYNQPVPGKHCLLGVFLMNSCIGIAGECLLLASPTKSFHRRSCCLQEMGMQADKAVWCQGVIQTAKNYVTQTTRQLS